ncbi:MAG: polysaccharide deacetylase family protein [Solirubrobacterales bacterium]|nr:polysaccharide deacetylase family protein [Solirubrobacterales bacterium]MBV9714048.1 polysaccharide deacetylase family protein [Solirubrobacterales bacterium]
MTDESPRVTLTFDNGPDPHVTPRVLDALGERGLRATFFVVGERLAAPGARAMSERARAEGHWIGNHTWSHSRPLGLLQDDDAVRREIEQAQALIGDLAHRERWFRPMGGGGNLDERLLNAAALDTLRSGGYSVVLWNALPRDWVDPDGWVERALAQCRDGALLVLHDTSTGAMDHLERFLDRAIEIGVRFVQDIPPACVPIQRGEPVRSLDGLIAPAAGGRR